MRKYLVNLLNKKKSPNLIILNDVFDNFNKIFYVVKGYFKKTILLGTVFTPPKIRSTPIKNIYENLDYQCQIETVNKNEGCQINMGTDK